MDKINVMKFLFPFLLLVAIAGCKKEKAPCAAHYTGDDCTEQIPPAKVFISKAVVVSFDSLNNGTTWDVGGGLDGGPLPDLHIKLSTEGGPQLWDTETKIDCSGSIEFVPTTAIDFMLAASPTLTLHLLDDDVNHMTIIEDFTFDPYTSTNNFPSVLELQSGNNRIEMHITYEW